MGQPSKIKRVRQKKKRILDVKTTLLRHNASLNEITTYEKAHSCSVDFITSDHKNATTKVICDYILELVRDSSNVITPNFVVDEMRRKYGIIIFYNKGWRVIQHAYMVIRENAEEIYNRLPSYLHMIKENNSGTYTNIKRDDENKFQYAFFAYDASIIGWTNCRSVIMVDAIFLKLKYGGVLMIAVSKDGNNNIFPLTFGIVDSKTNESYNWFFNQLRNAIGHETCIYHMEKNLRKKHFSDVVLSLFCNAAITYKQTKFYTFMEEIEKVEKVAVEYLKEEEPKRWARLFHTNRRYNMLITNKSMNTILRKVRQLPILEMIDYIQNKLQSWFYEIKIEAQDNFHDITRWAKVEAIDKIQVSLKLKVRN
ncbi:uncharacterized protein LOC124891654 [Capsicum annuum]|uniref:uncharacterized protein LOC124891654 n=1 Tax=Capsicum annuum TaxID=4072 RepID=UPI001FB138E4|nr:uncharacterized protein LOC124891654 [Capsicum annuum]